MLLFEQEITIKSTKYKPTSFVIERFQVPTDLEGIRIQFEFPDDSRVDSLLIYDSYYNLRVESREVTDNQCINIYVDEERTSLYAKPGVIPSGDWFIAFSLEDEEVELPWKCFIEINGDKVSQIK